MTKVLFAGSFDPFTLGHKSIVDRTLRLFDEVVVAIGVNSDKHALLNLNDRLNYIKGVYSNEPRVTVTHYEGLTTDFASQIGVSALVRGVRDIKDFEYERQMADINRSLTGIETVLLFTEERYASISSSLVRELIKYGKDVGMFLPSDIKKYLR